MSTANLIVMPGAPALVPELAPAYAAGTRLCAAVRRAVVSTGLKNVEIVGSRDERWFSALTGSLSAWGAACTEVGGGNYLPELVARAVLQPLDVSIVATRDHIGQPRETVITVVVVDGPAGMTEKAPLSLIEGAAEMDQELREFLAGRASLDTSALGEFGVVEPGLWEEVARLHPVRAELLDADCCLGVGSYVAHWEL